MKITLRHREQTEVTPDAVTITIQIESQAVEHATSAARVNHLQNQIPERLAPLGLDTRHLRLDESSNQYNDWKDQPLKARAKRQLKIRIKHPDLNQVRLIMDNLSFESGEVTASLKWKVIESASVRKQLLQDAMTAIQKLAETAAPSGQATAKEISVDGANPHIHRHRPEDHLLTVADCAMSIASPLKHESTTLSPTPILFSTELTRTFTLK